MSSIHVSALSWLYLIYLILPMRLCTVWFLGPSGFYCCYTTLSPTPLPWPGRVRASRAGEAANPGAALFSLHTMDAAQVPPSSNNGEDIHGYYMRLLLSVTSGQSTDLGDRKELHAHLVETPKLYWDMKH